MTQQRTQAERTAATRTALIASAREVFARDGYADAVADEIVAAAGVTRGALYHHFGGKEGLFEAVFEDLERELVQRIADELTDSDDLWNAAKAGLAAFLRACAEPEITRIALLDAPTVLGWERWRAIEAQHGMGLLIVTLEDARARGLIVDLPIQPLADALFGALTQAAVTIAHSEAERSQVINDTEAVLEALFDGIRSPDGP